MDDYICPTCETECICSRPKLPVLKIKLTVPQTLQQETVLTRPPVPQSKRKRGRPPKAVVTGAATPYTLTQNQPKRRPGRPRKNPLPVPSPSTVTTPPARKFQPDSSVISDFDGDSFPTFISASALSASNSSASEAGMSSDSADDIDDDVDSEIEKEEEKLIRKEERERGKRDKKVERARVKRQQQLHKSSRKDSGRQYQQQQARRESNTGRHDLFHSDDGGSNPHSEWIIKTRRPSDADLKMMTMDIDTSSSSTASSSSSSEDEESDDEDDGDDADEEPDVAVEVEDEDEEGPRYTGLATGWSDSEESSFDADLFFANLSDSHSSQAGSDSDREDIGCEHGCPDPLSLPMDSGSQMELEVTGDGQLVFTTGNSNFGFSSSLLDFEAHHQPYEDSSEATPNHMQSAPAECEDIEMQTSPLVEEDKHATSDDGEEEYDGNTTDEDLVGPDQLPNSKALRIFRLPDSHPPSLDAPFHFAFSGLSGVNPLSTVSPAGSPVPSRTPGRRRKLSLLRNAISPSPAPSDILSGNFRRLDVYGEEDEDLSMDSSSETTRGRKRVKATGSAGPVARPFSLPDVETPNGEVFVVDDERKMAPSPYHKKTLRLRKRRLLSGGIFRHKTGVSYDGAYAILTKEELSSYQPARHSSMPPSTHAFSLDQDLVSSVGSLPELEASSTAPTSDGADLAETPPIQTVEQIALDDVLDPSFMDEDDTWSDQSAATNDGSTLSHFRRWDLISVGAFRKTRENALSSDGGGWGSDTGEKTNDYGSFLRSSPMNIMLWSNQLGNNSAEKLERSKLSVSPVLSPLRDDEGEKTPTTAFSLSPPTSITKSPGRRQERKSRRKHASYHQHQSPSNKNGGGSLHPHHQHHTHHHHHPNSKTRSASSSQRFGFFSPGSISPTSQ